MFAPSPIKLPYSEHNSSHHLATHLLDLFASKSMDRSFVVCCIGTDRSTGDSLGPLVGSLLTKHNRCKAEVFGTLDEPVHAMNLNEKLDSIHARYRDPFIIAVDASLGQTSSIGCIQIANGPLRPGSGVNKQLPSVGDMHMTGIVNMSGFMEYFVLQNTRLSLVMNMAEVIADSIRSALDRFYRVHPFPLVSAGESAPSLRFD